MANGDTEIPTSEAGAILNFVTTVYLPPEGNTLVVEDNMSTNMTPYGDITVTTESGTAVNYQVNKTTNGFTVTLNGIESIPGDTVIIRYAAQVSNSAVAGEVLENTAGAENWNYVTLTGAVKATESSGEDPDKPEEPDPTPPSTPSLTIVKKWVDDDPSTRPETLTFNVYKDGVLDGQKTVKGKYFGDDDTWRTNYDIEEYEVGADWWVEEADVPVYYDDYVEEKSENVFYVYNTYEEPVIEEPESSEPESSEPSVVPSEPSVEPSEPSSEPVSEPEPTEPTLPQTGQVWWPVILLLAGGAVLVAFGAFRTIRGHGRRER